MRESEVPGVRIIASVAASDADSGSNGIVRFRLLPAFGPFSLNAVTGVLTLASALDFENRSDYSLQIQAYDLGTPSLNSLVSVSVYVQVTDVNEHAPQFDSASYACVMAEDVANLTRCASIGASDADRTGNAVTLALVFPTSTTIFPFGLSPEGELIVTGPLDYETTTEYRFQVRGTDSGVPTQSTTVEVIVSVSDVNDNPPVIAAASYSAALDENVSVGLSTVVANISISDRDSGLNGMFNATITDDLGRPSVCSIQVFFNRYALVTLTSALNYEDIEEYTFTVMVTDRGTPTLNASVGVTLQVRDVNDNNPVLVLPVTDVRISEDIPVGSAVLTVNATDADANGRAVVSFAFEIPSFQFEINRNTGVITTLQSFDFELSSTQYSLRVRSYIVSAYDY